MTPSAPASAPPPASASAPASRPLLGILFMCLAGSFLPAMNGVAKLMSQGYTSEQVVWARTTGHLVFVLALFVPRHGWGIVRTRRPGVQFVRSCLLITSSFLFFSAVKYVPIAQAASISFTSPLIVAILAGPMLGERITPVRVIGLAVGFAGTLVVIRPGTEMFHWASLLILANAASYALYQVLTRRLAGIDSAETSVVYSALVGTLLMSAIVPFTWRTPTTWTDAGLLASLGVLGGMGHYCLARALTCAPANFVSPFQYWQMVGSVIVGYLMFAEVPDAFVWTGASMIIGAGPFVLLRGQPAGGR